MSRSSDLEFARMFSVANAVIGANYWFIVVLSNLIETCDHWGNEVWSESTIIFDYF